MQTQFPEMQTLPLTRLPCRISGYGGCDREEMLDLLVVFPLRSRSIKNPTGSSRCKDLLTSSAAAVLCENSRLHLHSNHAVRQNIPCLLRDLSCNSGLPAVDPALNSRQTVPLLVRPEFVTPRLQIICSVALACGFVQISARLLS